MEEATSTSGRVGHRVRRIHGQATSVFRIGGTVALSDTHMRLYGQYIHQLVTNRSANVLQCKAWFRLLRGCSTAGQLVQLEAGEVCADDAISVAGR